VCPVAIENGSANAKISIGDHKHNANKRTQRNATQNGSPNAKISIGDQSQTTRRITSAVIINSPNAKISIGNMKGITV
jgi:hypothetical protein